MIKRGGRKDSQDHNSDRWLLTYADMITLLMAFFIMMYSMSVLNLSKFRQAAVSIRSGFGGVMQGQGKSVIGSNGMLTVKPTPIDGDTAGVSWRVIRPLANYIEKEGKADNTLISIGEDDRGIVITINSDELLFEPGCASIRSSARPVLDHVATMLNKIPNQVRIEGYTCSLKPRNTLYPTNWELSSARAVNVLRYLIEAAGLNPELFSAAGYGSTRPVAPNDNESNRRQNRRVEIVILRPGTYPESSYDVKTEREHGGKVTVRRRKE